MWRPKDWEQTKKNSCARVGGYFNPNTPVWIETDLQLFEAGADAILTALKERGWSIPEDKAKE